MKGIEKLESHFAPKMRVDKKLTRKVVSYHDSKIRTFYRWYKYKEAFSPWLVNYLLNEYSVTEGTILDPFAGVGTTLMACAEAGKLCHGIELSPVGCAVLQGYKSARGLTAKALKEQLLRYKQEKPWNIGVSAKYPPLNVLRITEGAYPAKTEIKIQRFVYNIRLDFDVVGDVLLLALLAVLEAVSYSQKTGQFLCWDGRRKKQNKSTFKKKHIVSFDVAMDAQLSMMCDDIDTNYVDMSKVQMVNTSSLSGLFTLENNNYAAVLTSPPYCNRYDYTRIYALELAMLGLTEDDVRHLRKHMVCTVGQTAKKFLREYKEWAKITKSCDSNLALQEILVVLEAKELNHKGITNMVRQYFYEMACFIFKSFDCLKVGGLMFVVHDNVQYDGVRVPSDVIMSAIAEDAGFEVVDILELAHKKGNSSVQMKKYGRIPLRKSVCVWRKV